MGLFYSLDMKEKQCFKCFTIKPLSEFYAHPQMADGYLNKCKACTKRDVQNRYESPKFEKRIRRYERWRSQQSARKLNRREYQRRRRSNRPGQYRCNKWVANAIRDGRLTRLPCEVCGSKRSEAHHDDYRRPQIIRWFCFKHHREVAHGQKVLCGNHPAS